MTCTFKWPLLLYTVVLISFVACSNDDDGSNDFNNIADNPEKLAATQLYQDFYLASEMNPGEQKWQNVDVSSCQPGDLTSTFKDNFLLRTMYFRRAAGLQNTITENQGKSNKAQQAALMMEANGTLDHFPPASWNCFTADGSNAAANSNLSNIGDISTIDLYINDQGSSNYAVGHRRWILWPRLQEIGIGSTSDANAMWVIGNAASPPADAPEFISWPPEGYLPSRFAFQRWSFSKAGANFNEASVSMENENGNSVTVVTEDLQAGFGDPTIVWRPSIPNNIQDDVSYTVFIDNVKISGETLSFEYQVTLFNVPN